MKRTGFRIAFALPLAAAVLAFCLPFDAVAAPGKRVLTYSLSYDPPSIDPQKNYAQMGELVAEHLHEGLVFFDEKMAPVPGVAERWDVSKDGLVYTFHLRKDAKWQDGKPVTAGDFYYAWEYALQPKTLSKFVNLLYYIKNAQDIVKGKKQPADLGVRVLDDHTLEVTLVGPVPYFLATTSHGVYFPMRKDIVEANPDSWSQKPETSISNGPFVLKEYRMNQRIVLAKNPNYWNRDKVKLDELVFVTIPDGATALAAFKTGQIDGFGNVPDEEIPALMMETDEMKVDPRVRSTYLAFNVSTPPFTDRRVRQALSLAINKKELAENILKVGRKGATGYVPYGLWVEGEDFRQAGGDLGITVTGDVAKAKKLLADAGFPGGKGLPADLTITTSGNFRTAVEAIQEMWKKNLGIDVKIEQVEDKVATVRRNQKKFQMALGGWSAQIFHPIYFLDQLTSGSPSDYPGYSNPDYDALIKQSKSEADPKKVVDILHKAERLAIGTDFPLVPLYYETSTFMIKDGITGWFSDPIGRIHLEFADVSGKK